MTILDKKRLEEIFQEINELPTLEAVHQKAIDISLADIDDKAKGFLHRAIDIKRQGLALISRLVEPGELLEGETSD